MENFYYKCFEMSDIQPTFVVGLLASATCRTLPTGFYVDMKKGFPPIWGTEQNLDNVPLHPCYSPLVVKNSRLFG